MANITLNTLYDNIEAERARNHWTMAQTAEKLGISDKQYRNRLANAQDITATALVQYAKLFNCSVDYLLGLSDKITRA